MTCEELRDLLPGYVLDALEPAEVAAVEAHLRDCREHDDEVVELRATGFALALLDEAREPTLRARVMAATASATAPAAAAPAAAPPPPVWSTADGLLPSRRAPRRPQWWALGAAAALALAVFGAGLFAGTRSATAPEPAQRLSYAVRGDSGASVHLVTVEGSARVTVTMAGAPRLPADRSYQLWAIRDGQWISVGACNTDASGWWKGDFPFALRRDEEIALTIEPAGGSARPSTAPLLRAKF